ncbi:unnamed protein product [Mytilus coruscus]|uniref:Endonuclease/exonuclease/phosphatase domain-containing protein n=1 Tax=Mytilus coruscus TaxID=42192 RepID=A0A6J8BPE3_MYTCO|nr:unnamed protein product [Mytilus coruscus]
MVVKNTINIGYWNVNKPISKQCNKLNNNLFLKSIGKCDISGLSETKCDLSGIELDTYIVSHFTKEQHPKQKQVYDGLAILINKNVRKGVKFLENICSEYQWLILDKTFFFGFEDNMFLCFAYINSSFLKDKDFDILANLSDEISTYQDKSQVMIKGDFNARTFNLEDCISNNDDDYNDYVPVPEEYESDKIKQSRVSNDNKSCSRGKELLDMCISSRSRILDGRTFGDYQGTFTS